MFLIDYYNGSKAKYKKIQLYDWFHFRLLTLQESLTIH